MNHALDSANQRLHERVVRPSRVGDTTGRVGPALSVPLGELLERLGLIGATDALLGQYEQDLGDTRRIGEILVAHGLVTEEQVADALRLQVEPAGTSEGPATDRFDATGAWTRRRRNLQSLVLFAVAMVGVLVVTSVSGGGGSWYALGALSLLGVKLVGSARYRPARSPAPAGTRVAVVVCLYNEDPEAFRRCLASIVRQTRAPDEVWVIDDGSPDEACLRLAREQLEGVAGAVHRLDHNGGKRHAQRFAFERTTCEIVMTLDSDTELDDAAIAEGLRPFADPRVNAVTGNVRALNYDRNVLTRLIDLRYAYAFLFERAAYSTVGSVVCCCGSLSFYRTALVRRHLADFVGQTFLGVPVQFGDDRRLTQYALQSGRAVLQDTAVGYTLVPERIGHFRRQQLRWNKSFFRETLWTLRRSGLRRWPFWISLVELTIWIASAASLINTVYVRPVVSGQLMPWHYAAYAVLLAYARNVRYLGRPRASLRSQIVTFALAPLYSVLHVVLLTPLRLYALLTLRRSHWGTRARVEVHA